MFSDFTNCFPFWDKIKKQDHNKESETQFASSGSGEQANKILTVYVLWFSRNSPSKNNYQNSVVLIYHVNFSSL